MLQNLFQGRQCVIQQDIRGYCPENDLVFPERLNLEAEFLKQLSELLQQPHLFRCDTPGDRRKKLLCGNLPLLRLQPVKVHPLMGSVLVDQDDAVLHLDNNIGFQCFPHDLVVGHREVINILNRVFDRSLRIHCFFFLYRGGYGPGRRCI